MKQDSGQPSVISIHSDDAVKWEKAYKGEKFHTLLCDAPYHFDEEIIRQMELSL